MPIKIRDLATCFLLLASGRCFASEPIFLVGDTAPPPAAVKVFRDAGYEVKTKYSEGTGILVTFFTAESRSEDRGVALWEATYQTSYVCPVSGGDPLLLVAGPTRTSAKTVTNPSAQRAMESVSWVNREAAGQILNYIQSGAVEPIAKRCIELKKMHESVH